MSGSQHSSYSQCVLLFLTTTLMLWLFNMKKKSEERSLCRELIEEKQMQQRTMCINILVFFHTQWSCSSPAVHHTRKCVCLRFFNSLLPPHSKHNQNTERRTTTVNECGVTECLFNCKSFLQCRNWITCLKELFHLHALNIINNKTLPSTCLKYYYKNKEEEHDYN